MRGEHTVGGKELSCWGRGTRDKEWEALPQQPAYKSCDITHASDDSQYNQAHKIVLLSGS